MGRKAKHTYEQKLKACEDYLSGVRSAREISEELSMGKWGSACVRHWARQYQANGPDILKESKTNSSYSKEFKTKVVEEYLSGKGSLYDLCTKYRIRSREQIRNWISLYNGHRELRDYDPHPEVYMAERKKTTAEERRVIVNYCLEHGRNYKKTALHYGCSYSQVYQWVRKYEAEGEEGLADRRGKRKKEEELSELEKAQRRIRLLEHELLLKKRENEILKKAEEFERRWSADFRK